MRAIHLAFTVGLLTFGGFAAHAQDAVTATCKDGTNWSGARRSGACRGHQGVQAFGVAATPGAASPAPTAATPGTPSSNAAAPAAAQPTPTAPATPQAVAPGGGSGQVWVNSRSKVYHCQGDRDYGHTKQGSYMTEAAAKAAGDRPSRGKTCS